MPQGIVAVRIGLFGEKAVNPHPRHFGEKVVHVRGAATTCETTQVQ